LRSNEFKQREIAETHRLNYQIQSLTKPFGNRPYRTIQAKKKTSTNMVAKMPIESTGLFCTIYFELITKCPYSKL